MIVATVCMMRNEEIMAESAIRHWLGFSDFVMVFDHNSTDGTPDILGALREEFGERLVPFELDSPVGIEKIQKRVTNEMIRLAIDEHGADLVLPLDTDEFPFTPNRRKESVRDVLESLDLDCCYLVRRIPYVLAHDGDLDTSRFLPLSFTQTRKPLFLQSPKSIVTGNPYRSDPLFVTMGNHTLYRPSGKDLPPIKDLSPALYYAHYPYRDFSHFKTKNALEWLACYSNPDWRPGTAFHIQRCVERFLSGAEASVDYVKWAVFSDFWATGENIADFQFETIDPHQFFPDLPLVHTHRFAQKKDPFTLLLEQSLRLVEQYKAQHGELVDRDKELEQQKRRNAALEASRDAQSRQIATLESSFSYRLGRAATWLPRKLYDAIGKGTRR